MLSFKMNPSMPRLAAVAAILVAAATTGCSSTRQAVGQDNGSLNSSSFVTVSYTPEPTLRGADRSPRVSDQHLPMAVSQHMYPPAAR